MKMLFAFGSVSGYLIKVPSLAFTLYIVLIYTDSPLGDVGGAEMQSCWLIYVPLLVCLFHSGLRQPTQEHKTIASRGTWLET